ncbi:cyclic nucleotide-binding domain-containing protein [Bythopirellula polymerisocia]|uniref:Electron transport protein HydN n=1 Tax=Bythopirellula polymerisocia TaxID=2528003 RepID=A0A5C6CMA7_9BACT|nr:cyclic nucleotide-binding domain-containing protein [Bythopirellula polymerisocia]TWU24584.1 Electron transport protein HydN [Bythopirellula polymerisocia]
MSLLEVAVERPQRWDAPFGNAMGDAEVDQLLELDPFYEMDTSAFPSALPLREILKNDTRINYYPSGGIIVREGDYGNSAFLVLRGRAQVVLSGLDPELLGRQPNQKQGFLKSLVRMWRSPKLPEVRQAIRARQDFVDDNIEEVADLTQTRVFLQDVPRVLGDSRTVTLKPGEIFGELAALTRTPRTATVLAEGEAWLLEIRWQGLRDMMRHTDSLRQHVEQLYRQNSLRVHLRETPLLSQLPPDALEKVVADTVFESHGNFEWHATFDVSRQMRPEAIVTEPLIAEEGSPCDGILLVRSGFARLSHHFGSGHRTVAYLGKGQVFGLSEAIQSAMGSEITSLTHSMRALGYVDVLRIPQQVLSEHVFPYCSRESLAEVAMKHAVSCTTEHCQSRDGQLGDEQPRIDTPLLEFLVERRLINGQQAMVIDLDRCTRCDDCVRACAATHDNNPRFVRQGQRHGPFMIAQACMHCADPVCMIGCPTGAIGRDIATGIVRINDLTCIGCSTCANSCPYGNINMVEVRDTSGAILVDQNTQQPIHKATKCDLCADQVGGPACQRACPHDALVRMDLGNLAQLSDWVSR